VKQQTSVAIMFFLVSNDRAQSLFLTLGALVRIPKILGAQLKTLGA